MAKDRYTEERDRQEAEKKAKCEKTNTDHWEALDQYPEEEKVDDTVVNGPAGDMVEIEPNVFTNVDPVDDVSNDSVMSEGIVLDDSLYVGPYASGDIDES